MTASVQHSTKRSTDVVHQLSASQYLTFVIAGETYALSVLKVREIIRYEPDSVTRVPSAANDIRGVINLRGAVVSVVDLGHLFHLGETEVSKWTCIVIVEVLIAGEEMVVGIIVEAISQVLDIRPDEIEPPPPFGTQVNANYIVGMGRQDRKFLMILDIDRILSGDVLSDAQLTATTVEQGEPEPDPGTVSLGDGAAPEAAEEEEEPYEPEELSSVDDSGDEAAGSEEGNDSPTDDDQSEPAPLAQAQDESEDGSEDGGEDGSEDPADLDEDGEHLADEPESTDPEDEGPDEAAPSDADEPNGDE